MRRVHPPPGFFVNETLTAPLAPPQARAQGGCRIALDHATVNGAVTP